MFPALFSTSPIRPPARHGAGRIAAAASLLALCGCLYLPAPVEGVPRGEGWLALPLRAWIAEGTVRAQAVAACFGDACAAPVAVGVFTAENAEVAALEAVIRNPALLKRGLEANDAGDADRLRRSVRTLVEASTLSEPGFEGFRVSLARADGARPAAHGAVLARRNGSRLRFVLAVGPDAEAARATAVSVARAELPSR